MIGLSATSRPPSRAAPGSAVLRERDADAYGDVARDPVGGVGPTASRLFTGIKGGVPPTQVAAWAGHRVDVLLKICARCVVGQDETAERRISEVLGEG